ncbi:hypothetical protein HYH03_000601 [Edaphochlamys debaryana]|uniref:Uncharacterized protein n=1 Tax=Edaphochlamys debaryana TaxID=47281 RepID=A0A835YHW2_9CHLO|nr:hypothetical protein HYH03_000601 [Edaphochlamys debaryana]|eukprot:KAG2502109.1 hypothetical protein HYH03_000601 [Edaphochlamys debaryana]
MRLDKADTPSLAVELLKNSKASPAATSTMTFLHIAGLRALARCYAPKEARSKLSPRGDDMIDLQNCIRDSVSELHARLGLLSYSQLADALASLAVLLPLAQWPLRKDRLLPELAAALPAAAAAADRVSPVPLPDLRSGLGALRDLAIAGSTGGWPSAGPAMAAAANYLRRDLYGSQDVKKRLGSADMAGLCAAVELAALFDVDPGPSFVASACGRMSRLLAEATEAGVRAELDRAAAARIEAKAQAKAAQETAQSDGDDNHQGENAGDGSSSTASRRKDRGAPGSGKRTRGGAPTAVKHQPFDVTSLARALIAWCRASPQHAAPSDAWLQAHAAAVLRAYDPATAHRRWELACKLEKAQRALRFLKAETAGKGPGSKKAGKLNPAASSDPSDTEGGDAKEGAPASRRRSRKKEGGRGAEGAAAVSAAPAVKDSAAGVKPGKDAVILARLEAKVTSLTAQIKALGPVVSSDLTAPPPGGSASKQKQAPPLSGPWRADGMVLLLVSLGTRLGPRAGEEVGRLAEAAVAAHLEDMPPSQLVAALTALAMLQHRPSAELVPAALRRLAPALGKLQGQDGNRLLRALRTFEYTPPASARDGAPSATTLLSSISVDLSSTDDLVCFLQSCQQWNVPYPRLETLQTSVEQRVLYDLPPDRVSTLSARAQMVAKDVAPKAGIHTPGPESDGRLRSQLLFGVMLPLASLRQAFANPDMLDIALADWHSNGYPGLDASNAALVLNSFAFNRSWPLLPGFRRELLALMPTALAAPCASPRDLSRLLLAVGRAVRLIADKVQRSKEPDLAAAVAPATAAALLPALERLMALRPSASHLGLAAQGLFVEARWRPTQLEPAAGQPGPAATAADPDAPSRQLLARMLEAARASLAADTDAASGPRQPGDSDRAASEAGGGRAAGPDTRALAGGVLPLAYLLSACVELRHRPSTDILAVLYVGATGALRRNTQVENTVQLLNALSAVERGQGPGGAPAGEPSAAPSKETAIEAGAAPPAATRRRAQQDAAYQAARAELLATLALALLQEQSLKVLSAQPDALVTSVRQLAVLGLRPEPTWLESYVSTVKDLAPQLSRTGLAYAAEGLALLRAAPPVVVLEVLLAQAEREDLRRFDVFPLGLLLGGVHTLWQNRLREQGQLDERVMPTEVKSGSGAAGKPRRRRAAGVGQPALPLSDKALNIIYRATALFVSEDRREKVLPRYSQAQLLMVSGAVAALELQRSRERGGRVATADLLGRVEPEWLLECCTSLIQARIASARATGQVLAPPPQLVVSLLRLASYTLCGSQDIVRLPRSSAVSAPSSATNEASRLVIEVSAGAAQAVSRYVRLALGDLARESGIKGPKLGKGRAGRSVNGTAQGLVPSTSEWATLLEAVLAAGIPLETPFLAAYASSLFGSVVATSSRPAVNSDGMSAEEAKAVADEEAWEQLCGGMSSLLLRALPWAPAAQQITRLHSGLLDRPEALEAASGGQLAIMATYAAAVGKLFSQREWWRTLANEVRRRGPPPPVAAAAVARQKLQSSAEPEAAITEAVDAWGEEYDSVRLCLDDLAAMVYGMDQAGLAGRRVEDADAWVRQLLEMSAETGATVSTAVTPPSEQQLLRALALLWTSRRLGRLECVPPRVWAVAFGHTGPAPWPQPAKALPAKQLGQLALLWAEVARAGNPAGLAGPSSEFGADLLAGLEAASKQGAHVLQPTEAAAGLVYLSLPSAEVAGLYPSLALSATAGLGAEVPLEDIGPLLERVPALPFTALQSLVERLTAKAAKQEGGGKGQAELLRLPVAERVELARRVLLAAPPSDPYSIQAVLPLLQALLPNAEAELYGMAAQERIGPAVLAAALDALEEVTIRTDEPVSGQTAVVAACMAAGALAHAAKAKAPKVKRPAATPGEASSLPPERLAPLAAAILVASGGGRLPGSAASALIRLLSVDGVPQLMPVTVIDAAVGRSLQDTGRPMPDATAAALDARMRFADSASASPAYQDVARARALRRAGASARRSHAALLALHAQPGQAGSLAPDQILVVLRELYDSGVVERVAPMERHLGLVLDVLDPDEAPEPIGGGTDGSVAGTGAAKGAAPDAALAPAEQGTRALGADGPAGAGDGGAKRPATAAGGGGTSAPAGDEPLPPGGADDEGAEEHIPHSLAAAKKAKVDAHAEALKHRPARLRPFSRLALQLLRRFQVLTQKGYSSVEHAAEALELIQRLRSRLEGMEGRHRFWGCVQGVASASTASLRDSRAGAEPLLQGRDGPLWRLLEAGFTLAGKSFTANQHSAVAVMLARYDGWGISVEDSREAGQLADATRETVAAAGRDSLRDTLYTYCGITGVYFVQAYDSLRIVRQAQPLLQRHREALAPFPGMTMTPRPKLARDGEETPMSPFLSTRQLGVLFGLTLHGRNSADGLDQELAEARDEVGELYRSSLDRLAARTDLPPLAHLTAVLRALEPAVVVHPQGEVVPEGVYDTELPVERWLAPPLLRILTGEADRLYGPYGDGPYDLGDVDQAAFEEALRSRSQGRSREGPTDVTALVLQQGIDLALLQAPVRVDGETLVAGLVRDRFRPAAMARGLQRLQDMQLPGRGWPDGRRQYRSSSYDVALRWDGVFLPPWLAPPVGSRHSDGSDPAGDALREAYARRAGAWLAAARGVHRTLFGANREEALRERLQAAGYERGKGRWATLFAAFEEDTIWGGVGGGIEALAAELRRALEILRPEEPDDQANFPLFPLGLVGAAPATAYRDTGGRGDSAGGGVGGGEALQAALRDAAAQAAGAFSDLAQRLRKGPGPEEAGAASSEASPPAAEADAVAPSSPPAPSGPPRSQEAPQRAAEAAARTPPPRPLVSAAEVGAQAPRTAQPPPATPSTSGAAEHPINPFEVAAEFQRKLAELGIEVDAEAEAKVKRDPGKASRSPASPTPREPPRDGGVGPRPEAPNSPSRDEAARLLLGNIAKAATGLAADAAEAVRDVKEKQEQEGGFGRVLGNAVSGLFKKMVGGDPVRTDLWSEEMWGKGGEEQGPVEQTRIDEQGGNGGKGFSGGKGKAKRR